jgi:hypothetical protein
MYLRRIVMKAARLSTTRSLAIGAVLERLIRHVAHNAIAPG